MVVGPATGGIGAHAAALAGGIAARGASVAVVCPPLTAERFAWRVPVEPAWPGTGSLGVRWRGWRRLRALVRTADVVHAQGHQAGVLALLAARRARPRPAVVVSWHNAVLGSGPLRWVRGLAECWQVRRADVVTGASMDLVERARALGARRAEIAPVAAPRATQRPPDVAGARRTTRTELGLEQDAHVVLTVSRIAPQKRLDVLVEAARRLDLSQRGSGGPVTWLVVGDGDPSLGARLREQVADAAVDVRFLGARDDVSALLAAADVFALVSRWEARPLVIQEAMAAGVPVVATAVGGVPELVGDTALLVAAGDADRVAQVVAALLRRPDQRERLGAAGRSRFAALPDASDVTRSWWERYAGLAASTPGLR